MTKHYNDIVETLFFKHFANRKGQSKSEISLSFLCAVKIARKFFPEEFAEIFSNITTQEHVDYFHKSFRQVDVFSFGSMDSLFYNIISLFESDEWDSFNAFMVELIELNTKPK